MQSTNYFTNTPDSFQAGIDIAENIKDINPEAVFIFFSIHYNFTEFFDAFYNIISQKDVVVFGGTGDGIYSKYGVSNSGISAVAVNSNGKIHFNAAISAEEHLSTSKRSEIAFDKVSAESPSEIKTGLVLADFLNDGVAISETFSKKKNFPFSGGLTGDDWQFKKGFVILNGEIYNKAVGFLGMSGDFSFSVNCSSGWKPIGKKGIIQEVEKNTVKYIDNKTAYNFVEDEFGIPPAEAELGVIPLAVYAPDSDFYFLRTAHKIDIASGQISCFGSIPEKAVVRVCNATKDEVIHGAETSMNGLNIDNFKPLFGIVTSCGGRKWILQEDIQKEVDMIKAKFGEDFPFTGFASFGEFGPFSEGTNVYSPTYFHNVSFSALVIGEKY